MISLRSALRELALRGSFYAGIENRLAWLLAGTWGGAVRLMADGEILPMDWSGPWFYFSAQGGHEFSLCLPERRQEGSKAGYFEQAVCFAEWLSRNEAAGARFSIAISEGYSRGKPLFMRRFLVRAGSGPPEILLYAENFESTLPIDEFSQEGQIMRKSEVESREIVTLPVELSLGELEMGLEDLLCLRPGTSVQFPLPENLEGVLRVAGASWARIRMKIIEGRISLETVTIEDVSEQNSVPQETDCENAR